MSEIQESLKKAVMAGFSAGQEGAETAQTNKQPAAQEQLISLLGLLPLDALKDIRARLDGLIAALEEKAPEEAIESIREACLKAPSAPAQDNQKESGKA